MQCNLCKKEKNVECFRPSKTSSRGVNITCRTCQSKQCKELVKQKNAFFKEYYESIIKIDTIVCAHCKAVKVRQDFPKYNPNCRECMSTD